MMMMTSSSRNAIRHDRYVVMKPPINGPTAATIAAAAPTSAYAFFCSTPSKLPWINDCIAGSNNDAPRPPMIAQKMIIVSSPCARAIASAPTAYASSPSVYAFLRPMRSPTLLPIKMNAAETSASKAMADCTPLAVVPRSCTTAEIETFMIDVSTTRTNIAIANNTANVRLPLSAIASTSGVSAIHVGSRGGVVGFRPRWSSQPPRGHPDVAAPVSPAASPAPGEATFLAPRFEPQIRARSAGVRGCVRTLRTPRLRPAHPRALSSSWRGGSALHARSCRARRCRR